MELSSVVDPFTLFACARRKYEHVWPREMWDVHVHIQQLEATEALKEATSKESSILNSVCAF